ncbi:MAG: hypothetical protein ACK5KQ_00965 [Anaerorhabdus sp.]
MSLTLTPVITSKLSSISTSVNSGTVSVGNSPAVTVAVISLLVASSDVTLKFTV